MLLTSKLTACCLCAALAAQGLAQQPAEDLSEEPSRLVPRLVELDRMINLRVSTSGRILEHSTVERFASGGQCPQQVSAHTDADFTGGSFVVQAGFAESEIAATSYTLDPGDFPLRVDLMEMIFATSGAIVQTTTQWSVMVWEGTPATGNLVALFSSDDKILPPIVLPPGTSGVNVAVAVDPGDPEQIIVNDNGSSTFSIGFRIDEHHNQTSNPCLVGPPSNSNAFPTTDTSGLDSAAGNWLFQVDGAFCFCPGAGTWSPFAGLGLCTPSGDWVMRATWTPFFCEGANDGACCLPSGDCFDLSSAECNAADGFFVEEGSTCPLVACENLPAACCFEETGGCLDLGEVNCSSAAGLFQGLGTECASTDCFPLGACCLPNGSCLESLSPEQCDGVSGAYQGNDSTCAAASCPDPTGGCCFGNGFCLVLDEADCGLAGATWQGALTDCADGDGSGTADVCEQDPFPWDLNGDDQVDAADLAILLGAWGDNPGSPADFNGDGQVDAADLAQLLGAWGPKP